MKNEEKDLKKVEKNKRIKKEINKIKKIYCSISEENKKRIAELIYRAAFLLVMAQDMEEVLKSDTTFTTTTINASQTFTKPNPLLKEYRDTIKSYQSVIKQLYDLTKDDFINEPPKDELDDFLEN